MMEKTVKINVETDGFEEATEKIEMLVDAYDGFPAQLTIKNCRDCSFYIYPPQNKTIVGEWERFTANNVRTGHRKTSCTDTAD